MSFRQTGTPVTFINVRERDRAIDFYCNTLGLALRSSDGFGDFIALDGALLRLTAHGEYEANKGPVLGWNVADVPGAVAALKARGIEFMTFDGLGQDADGIWTNPDNGAKLAWFADPDGNVLMLADA